MRIAVLSGGDGWHVRDLRRAAALLGHEATPLDFRRVCAGVNAPVPRDFERVLVRTMPPGSLEQVVFRMDVLQRWQAEGVAVLNPPRALELCVDKYLTTARLAAAGLTVPPTITCQHADAALEAFEALGRDVVVKPLFGSEGRGMLRITDAELAWRTFRTLERTQAVLYVQQFVPHPGWDLRVLVVGGRVLTAMRRHAGDDWRTNIAQGGRGEVVGLTRDEEALALRVCEVLGTPVAGVDLLPGNDGRWYVIEANAVPGWRALAPVTGVDVALALARYLVEEYRGGADVPGVSLLWACLLEVKARKAGNVHRCTDFATMKYRDFLLSATAMSPAIELAPKLGIGHAVLQAIEDTRKVVQCNTNLGIVLLLAPLAAGVESIAKASVADSRLVYRAIRLAQPGGMGQTAEQDVADEPTLPLREVMALAADRDMIARQYVNGFAEVFQHGLPALRHALSAGAPLEGAILACQLQFLASFPDSLILRKRGAAVAEIVRRQAATVLAAGWHEGDGDRTAFISFDSWLRGERLNPGTTADLVTAVLFVALRDGLVSPTQPFDLAGLPGTISEGG